MSEKKNGIRLGDGFADDLKETVNQELSSLGKMLINVFAQFVKDKIQGIDLNKLFSKKNEEELVALWSSQLAENGLIPKGYTGLSDELLIENMHQEGYCDGLYTGYIITMMALADNDVPKSSILSVRDSIRPTLLGHHYNNRDEFSARYQDEKYSWIDRTKKESE